MERITGYFKSSEVRLFYFLNRSVHCHMLDKVMRMVTHLGSAAFSIIFPLALIVSGNETVRLLGLRIAAALVLTHTVVHLVKRLVNRPRPYRTLENAVAVKPPSCKYSLGQWCYKHP